MLSKNKVMLEGVLLSIFGIFLLFALRDLMPQLTSSLTSWYDYPYVIWVMNNVSKNLTFFSWNIFFETNAFYPFTKTLLFSDLLIPQTILYAFIKFFVKQSVFAFNLSIFVIAFLNYFSLRYFFDYFFKNRTVSFLVTIVFFFSPYFYYELGHYQMFTYFWFFIVLGIVLRLEYNRVFWLKILLSSVLVLLQFLSSVYISIYLCFSLLVLFFARFIFKKLSILSFSPLFVLVLFSILCYPWFSQYQLVKHIYNVNKQIEEFIGYSAHITDYLFFVGNTYLQSNTYVAKWNYLNKHMVSVASPGFFVLIVFLLSTCISFIKLLKNKALTINIDFTKVIFIVLCVMGFTFSLGPRLNVNGVYAHIPLPYWVLLKVFRFLDASRAPSRWSFIFYIGSAGLVGIFMSYLFGKHIKTRIFSNIAIFVFILLFVFADLVPKSIKAEEQQVIYSDTKLLSRICRPNDIALYIPYSHLVDTKNGTIAGLNYISRLLLSTENFSCKLINGYSGYQPDKQIELFSALTDLVNKQKCEDFSAMAKQWNVKYLVFREDSTIEDYAKNYESCFAKLTLKKKLENLGSSVYLVK